MECTTALTILFISRYDPETGEFTVPPGGDGVYYFSAYVAPQLAEYGVFDMYLHPNIGNSKVICSMESVPGDSGCDSASCSAILRLIAYDTVRVQFFQCTDNTPFHTDGIYQLINGFSGFQI